MPISTKLPLADRLLDASIDGLPGNGLQVTRQQFMKFFSELPANSSSTFLSNLKINSANTPTCRKITFVSATWSISTIQRRCWNG